MNIGENQHALAVLSVVFTREYIYASLPFMDVLEIVQTFEIDHGAMMDAPTYPPKGGVIDYFSFNGAFNARG